jgi:hypothetical protein
MTMMTLSDEDLGDLIFERTENETSLGWFYWTQGYIESRGPYASRLEAVSAFHVYVSDELKYKPGQ